MLTRRKPTAAQLAGELREPRQRPRGAFAKWKQARFDRKLGQTDHRRLLRAYYGR